MSYPKTIRPPAHPPTYQRGPKLWLLQEPLHEAGAASKGEGGLRLQRRLRLPLRPAFDDADV